MSKKLMIAIVALIGCRPAAAQDSALGPNAMNSLLLLSPNSPVSSAPVTLPDGVPVAHVASIRLEPQHPVPVATKGSTLSIARNIDDSRPVVINSMYDFIETPFASNVRVVMASFAGGRVQLSGYHCVVSSENFQFGLPGGGVLPARGMGSQSHAVILVPQNNVSGGFDVTFTLRAKESGVLHVRSLSAVNHAVMFIRGI